ncbi:MAG: V-type ATP synthase subunit E [Chitinivibrionales bacterium]
MESKVSELAKTIYSEGVEKGEEEASKIKENAEKEAEKIIEDARKKAEEIVSDAETKAEEVKKNTDSEIKLAGRKALNGIKQRITEVITDSLIKEDINEALNEKEFLKDLILSTASNWSTESDQTSLDLMLPADKREELEKFLKGALNKSLKQNIEIKPDDTIKCGFSIGPSDGSYRVSLSDEEFNTFIGEYLRTRTRKLLFSD